MKTMRKWLQGTLRSLLGLLGLDDILRAAMRVIIAEHYDAIGRALAERDAALLAGLARIEARLTLGHVDLSKNRSGIPILDYDTLQALAAKELDGPPPKDSPFAEI